MREEEARSGSSQIVMCSEIQNIEKRLNQVEELPSNPQPLLRELLPREEEDDDDLL